MSSKRFNQPWVTRKVKQFSRHKKRAFSKSKDTGSKQDISHFKTLQKQSRQECWTGYHSFVQDIVITGRNPKKLYSYIKRCDSSGIAPLKAQGVVVHRDPKMKATILNEQFSGVFNTEDSSSIPTMDSTPSPDMLQFSIGVEGVKKLLQDLDIHEATGPDNIPTRVLKDYTDQMAPILTLIYQASLQQGEKYQMIGERPTLLPYSRRVTIVILPTAGPYHSHPSVVSWWNMSSTAR